MTDRHIMFLLSQSNRLGYSTMHLSCLMTNLTKWHVGPAKTQISMGFRPVWSEFCCLPEETFGSQLLIECTAKTPIRLGRCPGWSESNLGAQIILLVLSWGGSFTVSCKFSSCRQRRLRSDWADAQADLSLHWAHRSFCWFCHAAAHLLST